MWQRFTERARKVIFYAQEAAMSMGSDVVSTEHLLLALLREDDGDANHALRRLDVDKNSLIESVESKLKSRSKHSNYDMSLSPSAKIVIDFAYEESRSLDNKHIGTEHILLGLIREGKGIACKALEEVNVRIENARKAVIEEQSAGKTKYKGSPNIWEINTSLFGQIILLEPLSPHHAKDLADACDDHMFDFFPIFPESFDEKGLQNYIAKRTAMNDNRAFAIIDVNSGKAIGSSSMFDIKPEHKTLEIGHTWIKNEFRGTKVNPEAKFLMLRHGFEVLKCNRIQLKTDSRNRQSLAAMRKLGAKEEGTLRQNMVMPDGYIRDSVYFSIIASEWQAIKESLLQRLEQ